MCIANTTYNSYVSQSSFLVFVVKFIPNFAVLISNICDPLSFHKFHLVYLTIKEPASYQLAT